MEEESKVLVVDDRAEARSLIAGELAEAGFAVIEASGGVEGWARFQREAPDLVVSDLRMPRGDGIELLHRIRSVSNVPVILLSGQADVPTAVAAIKGGAHEFLSFPEDLGRLVELVQELVFEAERARRAPRLDQLVAGRSDRMRRVRERIAGLAPLRVPVLVSGEQGSGRDCVVRAFQALCEPPDTPLVVIQADSPAAARPQTAVRAVYLDEVGRLDGEAQARWYARLRELEASSGARTTRVYASTSEDLGAAAHQGSFHPGLARCLLRFVVALPPLRERLEDLGPLIAVLLPRIGARVGRGDARVLPSALARLKRHPWAGNVRELAETVERLIAFSPRGDITRAQVDEVLRASPESVSSLRDRRQRRQREELVSLLEECGGNLAEVARRIGMSRGAVIYRAKKHGLLPRSP